MSANEIRRLASSASGSEDEDYFQHQESEIKEEVFTPDIQQVEQARLKELAQTRTLLRDRGPGAANHGSDDIDNGQQFISREDIRVLHSQLSADMSPSPDLETRPQGQLKKGHDYINQAVVDMVLSKDQTEGGGSDYINQEVVDTVLNEPAATASANSNGYKNRGDPSFMSISVQRQQPVALLEQDNMGEFEKRLLLAKNKSKASMPDLYEVSWYHPGISRHIAECLLVYKDIRDGTYLLRDCVSDPNTVTLSVRAQKSVKHYKVVWDGKKFLFGLGKFNTLEDFKDHFSHQPIISGDSGVLVQLRYPYPRGVSEPSIYLDANVLSDAECAEIEAKQKPAPKSNKASKFTTSLDLSINSKEGYLTKLGFHRKNWKKRWVVLYRNELKYFNCCGDKDPLKVIKLDDVTSIDRDDSVGKPNCFRLVTSYRTFFMYATSEVEANEWVQILDWRLKQQSSKH